MVGYGPKEDPLGRKWRTTLCICVQGISRVVLGGQGPDTSIGPHLFSGPFCLFKSDSSLASEWFQSTSYSLQLKATPTKVEFPSSKSESLI